MLMSIAEGQLRRSFGGCRYLSLSLPSPWNVCEWTPARLRPCFCRCEAEARPQTVVGAAWHMRGRDARKQQTSTVDGCPSACMMADMHVTDRSKENFGRPAPHLQAVHRKRRRPVS